MSIKYPTVLHCPKCEKDIILDTSKKTASTNDLLKLRLSVPMSRNSGNDMQEKKQDIKSFYAIVLVCQHCHTIIGANF